MEEFKELIEIADILNSPTGCPWDLSQDFSSLKPYILEEAHEALEAIDKGDDEEIIEELGDLFYTVVFYAKVAERTKRFSMKHIIETLKAKLIRRHPHVFGEEKAKNIDEVIHKWEQVKKQEKKDRISALDGIPKTLPALQRAAKMVKRMQKAGYERKPIKPTNEEEEISQKLLALIDQGIEKNIDIESAFRKLLTREQEAFRAWELQSTQD